MDFRNFTKLIKAGMIWSSSIRSPPRSCPLANLSLNLATYAPVKNKSSIISNTFVHLSPISLSPWLPISMSLNIQFIHVDDRRSLGSTLPKNINAIEIILFIFFRKNERKYCNLLRHKVSILKFLF